MMYSGTHSAGPMSIQEILFTTILIIIFLRHTLIAWISRRRGCSTMKKRQTLSCGSIKIMLQVSIKMICRNKAFLLNHCTGFVSHRSASHVDLQNHLVGAQLFVQIDPKCRFVYESFYLLKHSGNANLCTQLYTCRSFEGQIKDH